MSLRFAFVAERPGNQKYGACTDDALFANGNETIGKRQARALFLNVYARFEPVADLRSTCEIQRKVRGHEPGRRIGGEGHRVAERDIRERSKDSTVDRAARVAVFFVHSQTECQLLALAPVVDRTDQIENRTGAEQRRKTCRNIHLDLHSSRRLCRCNHAAIAARAVTILRSPSASLPLAPRRTSSGVNPKSARKRAVK